MVKLCAVLGHLLCWLKVEKLFMERENFDLGQHRGPTLEGTRRYEVNIQRVDSNESNAATKYK